MEILREALPVMGGEDKKAKKDDSVVGHSRLGAKGFRKPARSAGFRAMKMTSGLVNSQGAALTGYYNYIQKLPHL